MGYGGYTIHIVPVQGIVVYTVYDKDPTLRSGKRTEAQ